MIGRRREQSQGHASYGASPNVIRLDRDEHEQAIAARRLVDLGDVGVLEVQAAFAKHLMQETEAKLELAKLVKQNRWLVPAQQQPPRRWLTLLQVGLLVAIFAGVALLAGQTLRHPTLQGGSPAAVFGPPPPPETAGKGSGRVIARRTQTHTESP